MNEYARSIAKAIGVIECRDLIVGDTILVRLNSDNRQPHTIAHVERIHRDVKVTFTCGTQKTFSYDIKAELAY